MRQMLTSFLVLILTHISVSHAEMVSTLMESGKCILYYEIADGYTVKSYKGLTNAEGVCTVSLESSEFYSHFLFCAVSETHNTVLGTCGVDVVSDGVEFSAYSSIDVGKVCKFNCLSN